MTTIAFKAGVVAADRMMVEGTGDVSIFNKLLECKEDGVRFIVTGVGDVQNFQIMRQWFLGDMDDVPDFPEDEEGEIDDAWLLVFCEDGVYEYHPSRLPHAIHMPYDFPMAWGSGQQAAMAAMLCGRSAEKAIEIANQCDALTGNGVQVLKI